MSTASTPAAPCYPAGLFSVDWQATRETCRAAVARHVPEKSYVLAGAIGGPFVYALATPMRNVLTIATKDSEASIRQLYGEVFRGSIRRGYTGWLAPTIVSCPQFVVLGPMYHFYASALGSASAAILAAGLTETVISFGAQSRNSQMAYNITVNHEMRVKRLASPVWPVGPGVVAHIARNVVSKSGLRVLAPPIQELVDGACRSSGLDVFPKTREVFSDLLGCVISGSLSMPFHQLYNWMAITPAVHKMTPLLRIPAAIEFLKSQYFVRRNDGSWTLSRTVLRDIGLRVSYAAAVLSAFAQIERALVKMHGSGLL